MPHCLRLMARPKSWPDAWGSFSTQPDLTFVPVSPSIISPPKDWPDDVVMTGSWNTPGHGQLDEELAQFLEFGEVLYAGFGSMRDSRGVARADAIVQAARSLGMKTLMVTGWGGLVPGPTDHLAPDILVRESVPHTEVLPHCKVAIHHGGAGTLHAMLRAGVPSVIMPFLADQPWWARHLHQQKIGTRSSFPRNKDALGYCSLSGSSAFI